MAIYARPGSALRATYSPAATALARARVPEGKAATLAETPAPAWVYLRGVMSTASSTAIRQSRARATATE
jgi:nicotinate-nucleotide adenylyltransferase